MHDLGSLPPGFGTDFHTVVMTEDVTDMGTVHVDFVLPDKGPYLLMRLR